jgi:mono/diheme cytochrome c family protein
MIDRYVSPAEFRRLVSALLVVLGFIALAALFGFIVVPGLRYQAHTNPDSPVQGAQGQTGWLDPTDYPAAPKQVIPPIDPSTVMTPTPRLLEEGRELFGRNCATCHGPEGKGDGPGAKGLNPAPRNFTTPAGWKNGTRLEDIYRTLDEGIKGSAMVAYRDLRRKDRMALVHFVQSLGAFDHGPSDPQAHDALAKSFASAGEVIPNRIPVRTAMTRLSREFQAAPALASGDPVLREYVRDGRKAAQTLAGLPGWETSDEILAKGVVATLPGNGFAPAVATCAPSRWKELRLALVRK